MNNHEQATELIEKICEDYGITMKDLKKKKSGFPNRSVSRNGKDVSLQKFNKTFPVSKLHYYGPLGNSKFKKLNARAMHKFAVAPINPLIAVPGTALYDLHNWMLEQNIQYTMFGSGSKATTLSLTGEFDDIFADEKQASIKADVKVQNNII